jgi:hypothetical protein
MLKVILVVLLVLIVLRIVVGVVRSRSAGPPGRLPGRSDGDGRPRRP